MTRSYLKNKVNDGFQIFKFVFNDLYSFFWYSSFTSTLPPFNPQRNEIPKFSVKFGTLNKTGFTDGNPLLGLGYDEVAKVTSTHRIPPGGYSHKLW